MGTASPELIRVWRLGWYRYCDVLKKIKGARSQSM